MKSSILPMSAERPSAGHGCATSQWQTTLGRLHLELGEREGLSFSDFLAGYRSTGAGVQSPSNGRPGSRRSLGRWVVAACLYKLRGLLSRSLRRVLPPVPQSVLSTPPKGARALARQLRISTNTLWVLQNMGHTKLLQKLIEQRCPTGAGEGSPSLVLPCAPFNGGAMVGAIAESREEQP